jgi:hypothetical protein
LQRFIARDGFAKQAKCVAGASPNLKIFENCTNCVVAIEPKGIERFLESHPFIDQLAVNIFLHWTAIPATGGNAFPFDTRSQRSAESEFFGFFD